MKLNTEALYKPHNPWRFTPKHLTQQQMLLQLHFDLLNHGVSIVPSLCGICYLIPVDDQHVARVMVQIMHHRLVVQDLLPLSLQCSQHGVADDNRRSVSDKMVQYLRHHLFVPVYKDDDKLTASLPFDFSFWLTMDAVFGLVNMYHNNFDLFC